MSWADPFVHIWTTDFKVFRISLSKETMPEWGESPENNHCHVCLLWGDLCPFLGSLFYSTITLASTCWDYSSSFFLLIIMNWIATASATPCNSSPQKSPPKTKMSWEPGVGWAQLCLCLFHACVTCIPWTSLGHSSHGHGRGIRGQAQSQNHWTGLCSWHAHISLTKASRNGEPTWNGWPKYSFVLGELQNHMGKRKGHRDGWTTVDINTIWQT